jgi:hypothetical protein
MRNWINIVETFGTTNFLYHGTSIDNLWKIINDNALKGDSEALGRSDGNGIGPSLTRSYKVAKLFAYNQEDDFKDYFTVNYNLHGAVLIFDRKLLDKNFNVISIDNEDEEDEEEERIIGSITPLKPYLVSINLNVSDIKKYTRTIYKYRKSGMAETYEYPPEWDKAMLNLSKNNLINRIK